MYKDKKEMRKIFVGLILLINSIPVAFSAPLKIKKMPAGVFVLGGIHQGHENAKTYTYKRMGEIYNALKPDVLCVETLQKHIADKSFAFTPFDFKRYIIPAAQKDGVPIYGIDWWEDDSGKKWKNLQSEIFKDKNLKKEVKVFGEIFVTLRNFFSEASFEEINSKLITKLWESKSNFKYDVYKKNKKYRLIFDFEDKRNRHIVNKILSVIEKHPNKSILVTIGIDHKYYIEKELISRGIKVLQVNDLILK